MGKKGSWFSAIKRVFSSSSKEKLVNGAEKKSGKEKKGRGILKHGETKSFLPLFKEPSSIEKILSEADQQRLLIRHSTPDEQPKSQPLLLERPVSPPRITSPRATSRRLSSPRNSPPRVVRQRSIVNYRPEPTLQYRQLSATKIQAAYRGYMARRSFRALRGLVRLQGVVKGQNVKRQTMNAMKHMQLLVRVQTQIRSRRIQMLENQQLQRQAHNNEKDVESALGKWNSHQLSEEGDLEEWDDSVITKEEREARLQKKVEAIVKRERALAYAYSHKLWRSDPRSAQPSISDVRPGGYPWWWNWLDRQLPSDVRPTKSANLTPTRPAPENKTSPRPQTSNSKQSSYRFDNIEAVTPRSSRSTVPARARQSHTPPSRTPPKNVMKYPSPSPIAAGSSNFDLPMKDDDSLMSCPPFSVPSYMAPTVSAKAKARPRSNPKDRFPGTPGSESKRRFSFPLSTPSMGSFKWSKGGSGKDDAASQVVLGKHKSPSSIGDFSVDSAISMPNAIGRRPFNRFV